jgi:hypothetical protein
MRSKFIYAAVATAALLTSVSLVSAQERLKDGLLGAGAGAVVGGPVGAVAGGATGYVAGPSIGHSLDGRHRHRHHYRHHHYDRD